jgi:RND family efflux transporter MFP subunit
MEDEANWRLIRVERALDLANHTLAYSTLAADSDGVITAALVEPGQVVAAGQTVMRIARLDEKEALVDIPEPLLRLAGASSAYLTLWTEPDKHYAVRLRELAPAADPVTRTYAARFSLLEPNPDVAFGMSASVTISGAGGPKVARLPLSALVNTGTGPGLWSVGNDGGLAFRPVQIQRYDSTSLLVSSGVAEGERVVALGAQKLDAAQRVRVLNEISP